LCLKEAARDLTITHLGMRLTASYRWCMVSQGASWGMPDSLHQRLRFDLDPKSFGNCLVVVLAGASHRVFRSTLQGLNQSIVGLSPLSETTYSTSHEIPND
jgi:hypothetical protein